VDFGSQREIEDRGHDFGIQYGMRAVQSDDRIRCIRTVYKEFPRKNNEKSEKEISEVTKRTIATVAASATPNARDEIVSHMIPVRKYGGGGKSP
jgi:hypothetical protein